MRILSWIGGVIAALVLVGLIALNVSPIGRIYLPTATGITAKQVCSLHFVSGLTPDRARALYIDPLLGGAAGLVSANVDTQDNSVHSRVLGLWHQEAVYREGLGCTLVHGSGEFDPDARLAPLAVTPMVLDATHRDAHFDPAALNAALDAAMTQDGRNTLGVVVLHQGRLIAERYAEGVDETTPLHGWSMTKSLAATMAGVLTQRGLIDVTAEGQVPALVAAGRREITVDHLLRMTAGLAGYELNNGMDPNSDMLFTESDMATFAATREQIAAPGGVWDYQSGNTVLAGSALEEFLGDTPQEEIARIREWLFEPLGMAHSILESDEAGTLQWSSYMYASARDWARLGQLYLDGGRAPDGTRLIPEDWIDYVTEPTPGSSGDYGSGYWMYEVGLPDDNFMMNGFQGQLTYIIPSEELVIVRLGATNFRHDGSPEFARAVVAARLEPTEN
ncbi:serine hydrolase domain-containing protein [Hyphobacterium sp.]|uniref:serine hydrolase domain-containing protein n=1 Tax=Hyphobacterium sp. TaxID=2004662 RepID=UPI003BAD0808